MRAFAALLALGASFVAGPAQPVAAQQVPRRVALVTVDDFSWERASPADRALLDDAAVGALVPVTARRVRCEEDFWLTLSAGARAGLPGDGCERQQVTDDGRVESWPSLVAANDARHFGAHLGALAATLARDGRCVTARDKSAALGAAGEDGAVARYGRAGCDVRLASTTSPLRDGLDAARATGDVDVVVVVGLSPGTGHYGAVAVFGEGNGVLTGSPRERGLVTIPDLTHYLTGARSLRVSRGGVDHLLDLDRIARTHRAYQGVYFTGLIALPLLLYIALGLNRRLGRRLRPVALLLAAYPVAGFLVSALPWWRHGAAGCVVGVAAATFAVALLGRTEVRIAGLTAAVLAADLLTGAHLQQHGLASYSALNGGRYAGLGNTGMAVFATASLVVAGALARRYGARAWLAAFVPVVVLDAVPGLGEDFGGAISVTTAFAAGLATRARRGIAVLGALAGVAVAAGVAAVDYARGSHTHLGRFVGEVLHGGASDTLHRKASDAAHSVVGTWYPLLVAGSLLVAVVVLRRLRDEALMPTVRALAALWFVGSLVNDSGVMVAAAGMAVAVPLLVAYAVRRSPEGTPW